MQGLSFNEEFFTGTLPLEETGTSEYPTSVFQAIVSMPEPWHLDVATTLFHHDDEMAKLAIRTETWPDEVLAMIRKTDLCDGPETPVRVYLDSKQDYWVEVYEED